MFAALKSFKEKGGEVAEGEKEEDKREVVLADGKAVFRNLAIWMGYQKKDKSRMAN